MKARRRSLGNIRFIGELYNLKMLTARIIHECIMNLLTPMLTKDAPPDEESLESLCMLLTTVGKDLENETQRRLQDNTPGIRPLEHYFKYMDEIIKSKQTSARIKFMLQDLIDLRKEAWRPRGDVVGPKNILVQIHEEVAREANECEDDFMLAMKSWRHGGIRFFATLVPGKYFLWHLWVTAACGMNDAKKFRAEIRLSSNLVPDCSDVFYRPVLPFERSDLDNYASSLHIPARVVWMHMNGGITTDLQNDTPIPFTIKIFEKVFLVPDKADIDEKDESDQDEEDGK